MLLFESGNWHFNSEICYLTSKNLFDLKFDIWIVSYYFGILNLYFNSKKFDWVLRVFSIVLSTINHFYK